ncbi:hydrogenase expression/formation protein HypE [Nocardia seriolae]|uniref:Hydrogenase expression/formation protein HypE n=1 Tax=Nocardia seriolae TaxID=37332 RepID=A0ABC8AWJ4_9NOCA|nr:hydrogenase expression/formation protein HypE [Nocardia seriolae]APA98426.1 Hydrogenase expression/formation protein HypE [Nocardia seriolae]OJF80313.1 hydrogenase expression/formation protein HypE [Nocardia seriolae]PSK29156.1 hydrogenase expression/formation protein HypE [Nocardia seriolae]QOW35738.1 hydrogenase expression/formation protein HypE [Nocardia seriolae]QUN16771.1 hydrogenase expression/formation protein HypE [Nocardia seriolae]
MTTVNPVDASCPLPHRESERILLGHGSGGQLMAELIDQVITAELGQDEPLQDAAVVDIGGAAVVFSTDGYVVTPRFFPGGDIGALAVHGTVNDLAMRGARPIALSLAYVLEEGLPIEELRAVTASVAKAAAACGVRVVTGDTKVVGRGAADGIYITTTGVGARLPGADPDATRGQPGDVVLLSGPIGSHGTAILCARGDLGLDGEIFSDTAPLHELVAAMIAACGPEIHALRDPTRGGLASALNELAVASGVGVEIEEAAVPVPPLVASTCELLGLDPLHVANEGCLVAFVAPEAAERALAAMRSTAAGAEATVIGHVTEGPAGRVVARTMMGAGRIVDMLVGEQLPRIC